MFFTQTLVIHINYNFDFRFLKILILTNSLLTNLNTPAPPLGEGISPLHVIIKNHSPA